MKNLAVIALLFVFFLPDHGLYAQQQAFVNYEQPITGSTVHFTMVAIPGGIFIMGNQVGSAGYKVDEGPSTRVFVDSFWIEEHEVTYEEYILFQDEQVDPEPKPDGITRPSPPYIDFTLGMGKAGGFPANSMSQYAATDVL